MNALRLPDFIIGGTEKSGTTSVFDWLSNHPQVGAASRKETDFFREEYRNDPAADARNYAAYFRHCDPAARVWMEASPGYLGEAERVAPRLQGLVPRARVLFVLRDPVARLYSTFHFHRGHLNLPPDLEFGDYVQRCLAFDAGDREAAALGLDPWYLRALRFGCYAELIAVYRRHLPRAQVKVMFFEDLRADERGFMRELSGFLGIDDAWWDSFDFRPSNVTFSARVRGLHRIAVRTNALAEPLMRRYPAVKRSLVRAYKAVNQEREGYDPMPDAARAALAEYYAGSVRALAREPNLPLPRSWDYLLRGAAAA